MTKNRKINIRFPDDLFERMEAARKLERRDRSDFVRIATEKYIEKPSDMKRILSQQERAERFETACRCYDHNHAGEGVEA